MGSHGSENFRIHYITCEWCNFQGLREYGKDMRKAKQENGCKTVTGTLGLIVVDSEEITPQGYSSNGNRNGLNLWSKSTLFHTYR